ncbi:MAG TPA: hypothetical protein VIW03_01020 [Anaeromyxobacter sp.]
MPRVHLVTQAYGRDDIRAQALYAAWSALAFADGLDLAVHLYADDAAFFAPLAGAVDVRVLSPAEIRAWRGPHDFVHRLKPLMIRDHARRFPAEKVLYVDADVIFTAPARQLFDRIGPGRAVLHVREYEIATHPTKQLRRFRRRMKRVRFRGRPVALDRAMWNAGAVGLDASHFPLLDEWIAMVDEIYPQWPYWIHEQWAIGQLLQREGAVSPADDVLLHYWDRKDAAVAAIARELPVLRRGPLDAARRHLRDHPLVLPPPGKRRTTLRERILRILKRL